MNRSKLSAAKDATAHRRHPLLLRRDNTAMLTVMAYLAAALATARARWHAARSTPERGDIPDQIVWIALLVVLAIAAVGLITSKVLAKAGGIGL
jgi:hypothetical protein